MTKKQCEQCGEWFEYDETKLRGLPRKYCNKDGKHNCAVKACRAKMKEQAK